MIWLETEEGALVPLSAVECIWTCGEELMVRLHSGETRRLLKAEPGVLEAVRERLIGAIPDPVVAIDSLRPLHPVLGPPLHEVDGGRRGD